MKVYKMTRSAPEVPGAPTTTEVQEQDIPALEARGYIVEGNAYDSGSGDENQPDDNSGDDSGSGDEKETLVQKAIELKLGSPSALARMSVSKLQAIIEEGKA